jgi:curved DNA-binding protein CbpA
MKFRPDVDYYEILQVHPRASQEMVKKAYRTLMGELGAHPDLGGDEERAKLINEAYAVLSDPELRRAYDDTRGKRTVWGPGGSAAPGTPWGGGAGAGDFERLAGLVTKVLLSAAVIVVALMIARLLKNPILDLADLLTLIFVLLRIWNQVAAVGAR